MLRQRRGRGLTRSLITLHLQTTAERTSVVMASGGSSNEEKGVSDANPLRTGIVLLAWVSFIGYVSHKVTALISLCMYCTSLSFL